LLESTVTYLPPPDYITAPPTLQLVLDSSPYIPTDISSGSRICLPCHSQLDEYRQNSFGGVFQKEAREPRDSQPGNTGLRSMTIAYPSLTLHCSSASEEDPQMQQG